MHYLLHGEKNEVGWAFCIPLLIIKQKSLKMTRMDELPSSDDISRSSSSLAFRRFPSKFCEAEDAAHLGAKRVVVWDALAGWGRGEDAGDG